MLKSLAKVRGGLAARVDESFLRLAFRDSNKAAPTRPAPALDALAAVGRFYTRADAEGRLFVEPGVPTVSIRPAKGARLRLREATVSSLFFESTYQPLHADYGSVLDRCPRSKSARLRWYRHTQPRPAIVIIHGWGGGHFAFEERAFPVRWLFETVGLDVVLFTLPFHGSRSAKSGRSPAFPSPDPVRAQDGFGHAIHDVRATLAYLRAEGAPAIGVMGMSLGGFTTALLATVEPRLAFAIATLPFASLPRIIWNHGAHTKSRAEAVAAGLTLAQYRGAFDAIAPLRRTPTIAGERVLIAAGEFDRVTPKDHAQDLHEHFAGSRLVHYPGGHLFQSGRGAMFRECGRFLASLGLAKER